MEYGREIFLLWKDTHTMVIQVPSVWENIQVSPDDPVDMSKKLRRETNHLLEIIQSLLNHNQFGLTNWGYLITSEDGSRRIVYRNRTLYHICCRTWAPLVDESELEITLWRSSFVQYANWRDREVQLVVAYDDCHAGWVEAETKAREMLLGLDFTFEVLGHVVRDGGLVGFMLEPENGRQLRQSDRALVFEAVAKLQSHGLYFSNPWYTYSKGNTIISNGKVRFVWVTDLLRINKEDVEAMAKYQPWDALETLFRELDTTNLVWFDWRFHGQHAILIPQAPSPERLLTNARDILVQLEFYNKLPFSQFLDKPVETTESRKRRLKHNAIARLIGPAFDGERQLSLQDRRLVARNFTIRRPKRLEDLQRPHRITLLLASEETYASNNDNSLAQQRWFDAR
jgi:hypothetical protein